jgi:hypothetical protein
VAVATVRAAAIVLARVTRAGTDRAIVGARSPAEAEIIGTSLPELDVVEIAAIDAA